MHGNRRGCISLSMLALFCIDVQLLTILFDWMGFREKGEQNTDIKNSVQPPLSVVLSNKITTWKVDTPIYQCNCQTFLRIVSFRCKSEFYGDSHLI